MTTARAWSHVDEQAARAEERITYEVQQRYGVDVRDVEGREPGALGAALVVAIGFYLNKRRKQQREALAA